MVINPPLINKKDIKFHALNNYDGYGDDKRLRLSEIKKFDDKTKDEIILEKYNTMRDQSKVPYQVIKTIT